MSTKRFHLGWFTMFGPTQWTGPFSTDGRPWNGQFYVDMAKALERACFDFFMLEDSLSIPEAYGGSSQFYLKNAVMCPKGDPIPLATLIGASTSRLGVVATMSTMAYPPYLLARLSSTVDSICGGRFGWNIVTTSDRLAAQNFGLDALTPHDERYEMADEYVDLVCRLWNSWDEDAVVLDRETGTYVDPTKVRPINFEGKYFKSRGPLNTVPSPQVRPTLLQAGSSPRGRHFAARTADCVIAAMPNVTKMKEFRTDMRRRAAEAGRNPDDIKVLFLISPIFGETEAIARDRLARHASSAAHIEGDLALKSTTSDIDFSKFDLDSELPSLTTEAGQGGLADFMQAGTGKTLRQLVIDRATRGLDVVGTPDQVADRLEAAMEEIGGDGFLIVSPFVKLNGQYISEVCEGLVPALQRRGLVRTQYSRNTLRETLLEF